MKDISCNTNGSNNDIDKIDKNKDFSARAEGLCRNGESICRVGERISLIQKDRGLRWGTDSYLLASYLRPSPGRACELGCGSGIISLLAAAHGKFSHIRAIEIQAEHAELARRNAELNGLADIFSPQEGDVRCIRPEDLGGRFDVVFSNPPYMRADTGHRSEAEERLIARHEVCGGIGDFCAAAARLLNFGGIFVCVFHPSRLADLFLAMRGASLEPKRMTMIHPDAASRPSAVIVEAKLGGSPTLDISRPLIMYEAREAGDTSRRMTATAAKIYSDCSFGDLLVN